MDVIHEAMRSPEPNQTCCFHWLLRTWRSDIRCWPFCFVLWPQSFLQGLEIFDNIMMSYLKSAQFSIWEHSCIFFTHFKRRGTPWTGHTSITGPQTSIHSHTWGRYGHQFAYLVCGRKLYPKKTMQGENMESPPRKAPSWEATLWPFGSEVTALTTSPPCLEEHYSELVAVFRQFFVDWWTSAHRYLGQLQSILYPVLLLVCWNLTQLAEKSSF